MISTKSGTPASKRATQQLRRADGDGGGELGVEGVLVVVGAAVEGAPLRVLVGGRELAHHRRRPAVRAVPRQPVPGVAAHLAGADEPVELDVRDRGAAGDAGGPRAPRSSTPRRVRAGHRTPIRRLPRCSCVCPPWCEDAVVPIVARTSSSAAAIGSEERLGRSRMRDAGSSSTRRAQIRAAATSRASSGRVAPREPPRRGCVGAVRTSRRRRRSSPAHRASAVAVACSQCGAVARRSAVGVWMALARRPWRSRSSRSRAARHRVADVAAPASSRASAARVPSSSRIQVGSLAGHAVGRRQGTWPGTTPARRSWRDR